MQSGGSFGVHESRASADPAQQVSATDAAEYIADLTRQLARIARGSRLDLIASLLEMAQVEASATARRLRED